MGTMTTIAGQVLNADGRPARGQVVISWPFFQTPGQDYVGGETTYKIVNGNMSLALVANQDAQPLGMYYTATFELDSGQVYQEYWIVPSRTSGSVTMGQCRVSVPDSPSVIISPLQLGSLGAQPNQFLKWNGTRWVPGYASSLDFYPNTIGLLVGTTGNDVNVTGSPAALGANFQLNIPDASATARGVVTAGPQPQTFAGDKTFTGTVTVPDLVITGNVNGVTLSPGGGFPATYLFEGQLVGTRPSLNFIPGSNVLLTVTDDPLNNWVSVIIEAGGGGGGGGGMLDPTMQVGDMIVRGPYTTQALARGTVGEVLTVVPTTGPPPQYWSPLGVAWAPVSSIPWTSNVDAGGFALNNVSSINGVIPGLWSQSPVPPGAIYYNGGNVGVGTATPTAPLVVMNKTTPPSQGIDSTRISNDITPPILYEYKARGTEASPLAVQAGDWVGYIGFGGFLNPGAVDGGSIGCVLTSVSATSVVGDLTFTTNEGVSDVGYEKMRIKGNGFVGVGTTNPNDLFTVNAGPLGHGITSRRYSGSDGGPATIWLDKSRGTEASPQPVVVGDWLGYIGFGGCVNPATHPQGDYDGASIDVIVTGVTAGTLAADLVFMTNDGGNPNAQEKMRITSDGRIGIGTAGEGVPNALVNIAGEAGSGFSDAVFHGGTPLLHLQGTSLHFSEPSIIFSEISYPPIGSIAAKNTGSGGGDLIFSTRQSNMVTPAERVRIRSTGDVGINTSNPVDPLTILGMGSSGVAGLRLIQGDYGVLFRNDGNVFYMLATFSGGQYGGWSSIYPFSLDLWSGRVAIGTNSFINQFTVLGRSAFVAGNEPFSVQLAFGFNNLNSCTYVGTNSGGQFQVSNAGGSPLMTLNQDNWGMTVWGNCNITGCYLINGAPVICPSGGGVALSNVLSINGQSPSGGVTNFAYGNRGLSVNYQNTVGKALFVKVACWGIIVNAYCDSSSNPSTLVDKASSPQPGSSVEWLSISFWVLPGWFYRVDGAQSILAWSEWW